MVRNVDYDSRRRAVLAATINEYIKAAVPVSSEDIAGGFELSSATIRSIFSELEELGYLAHPYTSAGRVPTDKGYRYYVDFMLSQIELLDEEKQRIVKEYQRELKRLEDALELTSEVLTHITHYTSIVSFLEWHDRFFYKGIGSILEEPEFQDVNRLRVLIKMLEEKQRLLHILNRDFNGRVRVYIGEELGCSEIDNCAMAVALFFANKQPAGRLAVLGPARMKYDRIIPALEYISDVLSEVLTEL
jgi:transcriptional regulator of heat shock response